MASDEHDILHRLRRVLGLIFLIIGPGIAGLAWYSTLGPLHTAVWFEQNRAKVDPAAYASAEYHANHARATRANRWQPTGFATLAVTFSLIGTALLLPVWTRRTRLRTSP